MCGILGFITDKPNESNYSMLGDLLYVSSSRGTDATGVAIVEPGKIKVVKEDISSDKFIKKHYTALKREISKAKVVLGHTRLATQGHQKDNNNNHPIIGIKYVMVHNGTCSTMERVKGYQYKGMVDSEILLSYVEKKGLVEGLEELRGSAAVAIIHEDEPSVIYLWRHSNPLWVAYNPEKKAIFFASTEDILREGLADLLNFFSSFHIRQLAEDVLYKVTCNPLDIQAIADVEPKPWSYSSYRRNKHFCASSRWDDYHDGLYGSGGEGYDNFNSEVSDITPLNSDIPPESIASGSSGSKVYSGFAKVYQELLKCRWDSVNKVFTTDKPPETQNAMRYYFNGQSHDFLHWRRLEGGGHVSIDKKLIKFFDHSRKSHFLMTVVDAIREGLIDLSK